MKKLLLRYRQIRTVFMIYLCRILCLFQKRKYWVLFERGTDARDNGYFFYSYLKQKHPEIKLYFIIDKKSADFHKVKEDAVAFGSFKNYWVLANAEKLVSTHYYFGAPYLNKKCFDFCRLYKNFYFLQHGIMMNRLPIYFYNTAPMKLFVCGARPEYEYIKDTYGYPESVAEYTGLARYDSLQDAKIKRQILLMPTWRRYITSRETLVNSGYFKNWQAVLSDERLKKLLDEHNIDLIFYPHYEIQKFITEFSGASDRIKIAAFENYDVHELLKESALLVTDYSSVFFDFAYMEKPIIYFQPDKEDFYKKHYEQGYFSFDEMGFGKVCTVSEEVIKVIEDYLCSGMKTEDIYKERIRNFFPLRDAYNCKRIYDAIMRR